MKVIVSDDGYWNRFVGWVDSVYVATVYNDRGGRTPKGKNVRWDSFYHQVTISKMK